MIQNHEYLEKQFESEKDGIYSTRKLSAKPLKAFEEKVNMNSNKKHEKQQELW